jgi:methanogenic corrinoid protein MtbC1
MDRLNAGMANALSEAPPRCETRSLAHAELLLGGVVGEPSLQERMARIVRTIEADIIPRLVRAHRPETEAEEAGGQAQALGGDEVARFVNQVLAESDHASTETIAALRERGVSVEGIYLDLLCPAARELGRMWEDDECLFSDVAVAVGRLQRIMRTLSPAFGAEVEVPADGRRALMVAAPGEQHTFGLSMVGEFFRRAGWDVVCHLDPRGDDPIGLVRDEWFDVIGISAGVEVRMDWLKSGISSIRHASRNRAIGVMVGGPLFVADPGRARAVGADATASDGRQAPILAEQLLNERARRL